MKSRKWLYILMILLLVLQLSCIVEANPIVYGSDTCHFCRMTIVDKQHASEIVTKKGKVYKFDAIECMFNYLKEREDKDIAIFLVNGYTNPGKLIDATAATYLVSEGIPSPMGEYLTAFETELEALEALQKHGGVLFSWQEIRNRFKK
ncbi:nitrous oxide reductase accessory protein NosL [Lentiprolixibacter aurantiacus]|uniref:Nitrous oxide reductase accessory protein NosL n=1 Tax=Lentiprolixibacter aurantiacus TaxID=2993939 RepID=A0AAE3SMN5_9FLAO|nr:nitrous oxide reductase accessory protein NosL [Lentiprolixibacter aurantiacus]MCX2718769.1 nitrous oxide reductase accessory protein NosL [Lentiprolixibacter aurantiacus]